MSKYYLNAGQHSSSIDKAKLESYRTDDVVFFSGFFTVCSTVGVYPLCKILGSPLYAVPLFALSFVVIFSILYHFQTKGRKPLIWKNDENKKIFSIASKDILKSQNPDRRISRSAMRSINELISGKRNEDLRNSEIEKQNRDKICVNKERLRRIQEEDFIKKLV